MNINIMGFNISQTWDEFSGIEIFNNPMITGVIIVVLILIIMYCVFYDAFKQANKNDGAPSFWRLMLRAGFYTTLVVMSFVAVHYKQTNDTFEKSKRSNLLSNVVDQASNPQIIEGTVGRGERAKVTDTAELEELFKDDEIITGEKLVVLQNS
jgi:uncharacterized membrane protein YukC